MRKLLIVFIIIFLLSMFSCCNDDDFAPYTNKNYNETIHLTSNLFVISDIKKELYQIVSQYANNIPLTYADYNIFNESKGTVEYHFFKPYKSRRAIAIIVYVNLSTKNITNINYENGNSKRVRGFEQEILHTADKNVLDYYNKQKLNNNQFVWVKVSDLGIEAKTITKM